jgi:hypothetical protein
VLQGVRADERRMEAREAAEARSANKSERGSRSRDTRGPNPSSTQAERAAVRSTNMSDRGPRSMERKDQNPSATQAERVNASPSEGQVQDGNRSSDEVRKGAEDSWNALETTAQPSQPGLDAQGQAPMPFVSLVPSQVPAHANDQTNVHTDGEGDLSKEDHEAEREAESGDDSSRSLLLSSRATNSAVTVSDLPEGPVHSDNERRSPQNLPTQEPDEPVIHSGGDSHRAQVVKPGFQVIADDAGPEIANPVETRPVPLESQPGSVLSQPEAIVRRVSPASLGVGLADGKPESTKTDSVLRDGGLSDRSTPAQMNWYAQSLRDAQDSGARPQWGFQQGQHVSVDGAERFSELWGEQQYPQHDQSEIILPQATVIDRQVAGGSATESMMAGAHGRVISSPPPPPSTPPSVSPAPSSLPAQDATESSVRFMTRSVMFDVAQPDLGHVNIRVAMTNDTVHTHLSADRLEVGQFLVNGQDRLQAAFQANGLDMGQFRVDIDRQSAGRSFQQDSSQEQGHTGNQRSHDMKWGQSLDRQDDPRASLHGLLNVVA